MFIFHGSLSFWRQDELPWKMAKTQWQLRKTHPSTTTTTTAIHDHFLCFRLQILHVKLDLRKKKKLNTFYFHSFVHSSNTQSWSSMEVIKIVTCLNWVQNCWMNVQLKIWRFDLLSFVSLPNKNWNKWQWFIVLAKNKIAWYLQWTRRYKLLRTFWWRFFNPMSTLHRSPFKL